MKKPVIFEKLTLRVDDVVPEPREGQSCYDYIKAFHAKADAFLADLEKLTNVHIEEILGYLNYGEPDWSEKQKREKVHSYFNNELFFSGLDALYEFSEEEYEAAMEQLYKEEIDL